MFSHLPQTCQKLGVWDARPSFPEIPSGTFGGLVSFLPDCLTIVGSCGAEVEWSPSDQDITGLVPVLPPRVLKCS